MIKPTQQAIANAHNRTVPDVIASGLHVLFCGINPGLYSAATGHHFARPGNRFWPTLYRAGFTPHLFTADQEYQLLDLGYGITNIVDRASANAAELGADELAKGAEELEKKVRRYKPEVLAILGISAFRVAFSKPKAVLGLQEYTIRKTAVWVLPNPSGLNAHFPPVKLAQVFQAFRESIAGHREV